MKVLVTGSNGQLGHELISQIENKRNPIGPIPEIFSGCDLAGIDIGDIDIANEPEIMDFIERGGFEVIFNCAAFTDVDGCEAQPDTAFNVNADAPGYIAKAAEKTGAKLIHISTDYVFSGDEPAPRLEFDPTEPKTVYGKSKLSGEQRVFQTCKNSIIVRTAWLYGATGKNFVKTMLELAKRNNPIKVVNDQFGNPTNAVDLAYHLMKLAASKYLGIFHCTNNGVCSWYEFASQIMKNAGFEVPVIPCTTAEFPRPAPRPAFSALDNARLRETVGDGMRDWRAALADHISNMNQH